MKKKENNYYFFTSLLFMIICFLYLILILMFFLIFRWDLHCSSLNQKYEIILKPYMDNICYILLLCWFSFVFLNMEIVLNNIIVFYYFFLTLVFILLWTGRIYRRNKHISQVMSGVSILNIILLVKISYYFVQHR